MAWREEDHDRWPADAPDSRGGQFREQWAGALSARMARIPEGFNVGRMEHTGWADPGDPLLAHLAETAHRHGFTGMTGDASGGSAAVDPYSPDVLLVGPRHDFTPEGFAEQRARANGKYMVELAARADPVEFFVAHEAGHRHHFKRFGSLDYDHVSTALERFYREQGIQATSEFGDWGQLQPGELYYPTAEQMGRYALPEVLEPLQQRYGLGRYSISGIAELVADAHALWTLGDRSPLVALLAEAEGWG